jgi:predicted transcriptional regulator
VVPKYQSASAKEGQTLPESTQWNSQLISLTADVVSAYVSNNPVPAASLADLIGSVHSSLSGVGRIAEADQPQQEPAVNPKRSVFPDYIVSLEDGKKFKSLKRHLRVQYGLTPEEYREKWGLARDYPMVAPNYAARRSALAKSSGLGRKASTPAKKTPAKRGAK